MAAWLAMWLFRLYNRAVLKFKLSACLQFNGHFFNSDQNVATAYSFAHLALYVNGDNSLPPYAKLCHA